MRLSTSGYLRATLPVTVSGIVAVIHSVWGGMLISGQSATFVTVHNDTSQWLGGRHALGAALLAASVLSVYAMLWDRRIVFFVPQQAVLMMEALAAVMAINESAFGDGVQRPRLFIAADQMWIIVMAVAHAYEMSVRWTVREILGEKPLKRGNGK